MKAGDRIRLSFHSNRDPISGRVVERLSDNRADTLVTYFTKEMMTPDNRGILVGSNRTGAWLPYRIDPEERSMRCLSTTPMADWSSPAIGGERVVYISTDRQIGWVPVEGGTFQPIMQLPPERDLSEVCASACGRYAVLIYSEKAGETAKKLADGSYPSRLTETAAFGPRSVVLRVDLETGLSKGLTGCAAMLAHPMISPANPEWMEYCAAASWRQVQRMFSVRYFEAGAFVETKPLFRQKLGIDAVGHEFFLEDGRVAAVWMRFAKISDAAVSPRQSYILVIDPRTGRSKSYRTPGMIYNHLHGRDGKLFVSEGRSSLLLKGSRPRNPNELDLLCRYDVKGDRTVPTILCAHGCSWKGQLGHPHAVLCRKNRHCYFNSDRDGHANVYRVRM